MNSQKTNARRRSKAHLIAERVEVPDCIDLQRRVDATTRGSLEVAKPLHDIYVRVRSRYALLHVHRSQLSADSTQPQKKDVPSKSRCASRQPRRDRPPRPYSSLRPRPTPRLRLRERPPDPFERNFSRRPLAVSTNASRRLDDISSGLSQRGDLRDVELRAYIFEWGILERLDVARA